MLLLGGKEGWRIRLIAITKLCNVGIFARSLLRQRCFVELQAISSPSWVWGDVMVWCVKTELGRFVKGKANEQVA